MDGLTTPPRGSAWRDPFADMTSTTQAQVLREKGWREVSATSERGALELTLGELVLVVTEGASGLQHLERLEGAHGTLPSAPSWRDPLRTHRVFRVPPGERVLDAPNMHGVVPGMHVRASGVVTLPPERVEGGIYTRWGQHPATTPVPEIPAWIVQMLRDPAKAANAWSTTRPAPGAVRALAEWEKALTRSRGRTISTFGNVMKIFRGAPCYAGRFRLNQMSQSIEFEGKPLPETHVGLFREQVEDAEWGGFSPAKDTVMDAVRTLAAQRAFHPVQEYLRGLRWDGERRLDDIATKLLNADADPLVSTMVRRWFISAVARVMEPGCQVDTALVLVGHQGLKKSSFFRALAPQWFGCTEIQIGDKDGLQQIHANWITEWAEIDGITSKRHASEVKAFISRRVDDFRPPYGRTVDSFPRSCVIVGSTNETEFLTDPTGSRRFWVVRVRSRIDVPVIEHERDQLWAEAATAYRAGEQWWLDDDQDRQRERDAEQYRVRDAWEGVISGWIAKSWPEIKLEKRYPYLTTDIVLKAALRLEAKDMSHQASCRVGRVMATLGYRGERKRLTKDELKQCPGPTLVHAWIENQPDEDGSDATADDDTVPI